jgi:hypothetical protein
MMLYLNHPIVSLLLLAAVLVTKAEWTPQSRFWKHVPQNFDLLENDRKEQVANVQSCFQLTKRKILLHLKDVAPDSDFSKPKIVNQVVDSETKEVILVEIESAISQVQTTLVRE